jgi:DNA-binding transcriptional MerR regulator
MVADDGSLRVGELADATGLTVRALHYYDEIGLLSPSMRSDAGHRAYTQTDVQRLYRICTLRGLGLSLTQIKTALDTEPWELAGALTTQLQSLDARLGAEHRLRARIAGLLAAKDSNASIDDLLEVLEDMTAIDAGVQRRISILVYSDLEAAHDYLVQTFGLGPGELNRDGDGRVVHAELQAGDGVLWLHPEVSEFALASPRTVGKATGMVAVMVDDVDAHYQRAVQHGATIRYAPVDQSYGYREYGAVDCEGHLWSFMKPLT